MLWSQDITIILVFILNIPLYFVELLEAYLRDSTTILKETMNYHWVNMIPETTEHNDILIQIIIETMYYR